MKSFLSLCSAGLLCLASLQAQARRDRFEVGITGGPSLAATRADPRLGTESMPIVGGTAGFSVQYHCSRIFSLHTGLAFERKGGQHNFRETSFGARYDYHYRLMADYFTIPLMLRATVGRRIKGFAGLGVYAAYLQHATNVAKDNLTGETYRIDLDHLYKRIDFGLAGGLGVSVPVVRSLAASFEVRENLGLINVSDPEYAYGRPQVIKNSSVNFLFGLSYRF